MNGRLGVLGGAVVAIALAVVGVPGRAAAAPASMVSQSVRPSVTSLSPPAGPLGGGTRLTIRGAGFSHVESVAIGGKTALGLHVQSATVLTVRTPAHAAGSAAIVVRTRAGTGSGAPRFHYLRRPTLSGLSAHAGLVSGGLQLTIDGSSFSYVTAVDFGALAAAVLPGSTATRLRVRTPASWAAAVEVTVRTLGGTTAASGAVARFVYKNPAPHLSGKVSPAASDVVAADAAAVSGGPASGGAATSWKVTLAASAPVPSVGQSFVLLPGSKAYPGGLAGTVTAVDASSGTVTVTPAPLDGIVSAATASFTGPLGNASAAAQARGTAQSQGQLVTGSSLTSEIDFGKMDASNLACDLPDKKTPVKVSGSFSLTLQDVEAHVEVDLGPRLKPFVDVWISYQPTIAFNLTAEADASCSLPPSFQAAHQKLFFLGDTGATIAIAPDASFTVSAAGTVTFSQHSYRFLGFVSNPDGSISRLSGQRSDPASVRVSAELKAEAYGGVQIQVGELNMIGAGMSIGGGLAAKAESAWHPLVCWSAYPFLRGTLYAYLSDWVAEWKLQSFQVELDLKGVGSCDPAVVMHGWGQDGLTGFGNGNDVVTVPGADVAFAFGWGWDYALEEDGAVDAFNLDTFKRTPVSGLAGITMLVPNGDDAVYALRDDGRILAWNPHMIVNNKPWNGNAEGELGDGTTRDSATPVLVPGITSAVAISAGYDTVYALLRNGTVMAWGGNEVNQLGDGKFEHYVTRPQLIPGLSGVRQVAGAWQGAFAVLTNGTVMKWGCDAASASENPPGVHNVQETPAPVPGITNAVAVAGGAQAGYALTASGTVWSWGDSTYGSLGRGNNKDEWYNPAPIPGLPRITAIAASQYGAGFARSAEGHLYTWGNLTEFGTTYDTPHEMGLSHVLAVGAGMFAAWIATT